MKKSIALYIFLVTINVFAQETYNIQCNDLYCTDNESFFEDNTIVISNQNSPHYSIENTSTEKAIDLHVDFQNSNIVETSNASLEMSYQNLSSENGGPTVNIYSELMNYLNFDLSGRDGVNGKNASELCMDYILEGNLGSELVDYINQSRSENSLLPTDRCVQQDYNYLETIFSCREDERSSLSRYVDITKIKTKRMCTGTFRNAICLKRKVTLNCYNLLAGNSCCNSSSIQTSVDNQYKAPGDWSCNSSYCGNGKNGYYKLSSYELWEYELEEDKDSQCYNLHSLEEDLDSQSVTLSTSGPSILSLRNSSGVISRDNLYFDIPNLTVTGADSYTIGISSPGSSIRDCLGFNGTSVNDYRCRIVNKGDGFSFGIFAISDKGEKSNTLSFNVQPHRKKYERVVTSECGRSSNVFFNAYPRLDYSQSDYYNNFPYGSNLDAASPSSVLCHYPSKVETSADSSLCSSNVTVGYWRAITPKEASPSSSFNQYSDTTYFENEESCLEYFESSSNRIYSYSTGGYLTPEQSCLYRTHSLPVNSTISIYAPNFYNNSNNTLWADLVMRVNSCSSVGYY